MVRHFPAKEAWGNPLQVQVLSSPLCSTLQQLYYILSGSARLLGWATVFDTPQPFWREDS